MSKITDIYNAIVDKLEANLTGYIRLPNPYALESNAYPNLSKGFGLAVGPGVVAQRTVCKIEWKRAFTIILVNQMIALENDIDKRELIEQELLDMHRVLVKEFFKDGYLGGLGYLAGITGDLGISFIASDQQLFLGLEMNLEIEYSEDPNT